MPKITVTPFDPRPAVTLSTQYEAQEVLKSLAASDIAIETVNLRVGQPWEYAWADNKGLMDYRGYVIDLINGSRVINSVNCGLLFVQLRDIQQQAKWQLTESGDLVRH